MQLFYITGTSSGLGLALAQLLLEDNQNIVIGISRRKTIDHDRYHHVAHDLKTPPNSTLFEPVDESYTKITLINNAGSLGPIKAAHLQTPEEILENYMINLSTPSIMSAQFIKAYEGHTAQLMIINVSSGAGKHPISSWSTYCASKAGLDLFSEVLQLENPQCKVLSLAPGIVDTPMQTEIRSSDPKLFPDHARFVEYKKDGELASAEEVAQKYLKAINQINLFDKVVVSVRDID